MGEQTLGVKEKSSNRLDWQKITIYLLLVLVLAAGASLRLVGVNWDESRHLHPDERFLSMVQAAITPTAGGTYFNTAESSLNPGNSGYTFFVYGTWPVFIVRYIGEWTGQVGYDAITILGRQLSAIADVLTILLVFFIGSRLYKPIIGLLGAAFYAFAVLPIQLSHFMTVDSFTNTFGMLTVLAAVLILKKTQVRPKDAADQSKSRIKHYLKGVGLYILFGVALGMATASKINAVTLALLLPLVEMVKFLKLPKTDRESIPWDILIKMLIAALISFLVFRICQPYAFKGPGFFNMGIDPDWWSAMRSLQAQNAGEVDSPPALQWARRPITFSLSNMVQWGMGLPLGIAAFAAFLVMGWQIIKHKKLEHLPLWAWTAFYFIWQATAWVRAMRYQILVYPLFALFAAWGLVSLVENRKGIKLRKLRITSKVVSWIGIFLAILTIAGTGAYAFAFTRIYTRDHSRIAASKWIYANIPGPINLEMETEEGATTVLLPYRSGDTLRGSQTFRIPFKAEFDSLVKSLVLLEVTDQSGGDVLQSMRVAIVDQKTGSELVFTNLISDPAAAESRWTGSSLTFEFPEAAQIQQGRQYFVEVLLENVDGRVWVRGVSQLHLVLMDGSRDIQSLPLFTQTITTEQPYMMDAPINQAGVINSIYIPYLLDLNLGDADKTLEITLTLAGTQGNDIATASLTDNFSNLGGGKGTGYIFTLDRILRVDTPQTVNVRIELISGEGRLAISSPAPAHESSWDDTLPVHLDGFSPYSDGGGILRGDLFFELYWPDDESKRTRFETTLDQADYVFISSNRQWGTTTRVPERYPLTSAYYRALLGCPEDKDLVWCYNTAKPGDFESQLGFELVQVFESYPTLGSWEFNDQFAEEAFSVYDHPKALIFAKTDDYDPQTVRNILRGVDLSKVINMTARQASDYKLQDLDSPKTTLMLTDAQLEQQREGGTWSELFDRNSAVNSSEVVAVIVLYLFVWGLGVSIYPFLRLALPGLADKGYPFIRIAGLILLTYLVWLAGSAGIPYTRSTILISVTFLAVVGIILAIFQHKSLREELRQHWRYYLVVEAVALGSFLFFLFVRIGNPDLWHPWKGGEKPMDFSYLNAIIKSTIFPPYDPWFAGGYINYYYYGQMVVSLPIKLLGIIPATAYNIILPLLYSMLCVGGFSVGWNIYQAAALSGKEEKSKKKNWQRAVLTGLAVLLLLAVLGNLGTVRMIINTFQSLGAGGANIKDGSFIQRISWMFQGIGMFVNKTPLPLYPGDWYWIPSRAIPGEAITEFPYFTYLYADLHAHLIALPMVVLSVAWGMSVLFSRCCWADEKGKLKKLGFFASLLLGGMVVGVLKPTNTWDYYTYLVFNIVILAFAGWRNFKPIEKWQMKPNLQRLLITLAPIILLVLISRLLYLPFDRYYGQGYSQIGYWTGERTPLGSYLVHWGLFLFLITSWFAWETYRWMAGTPISALRTLEKYKSWIVGVGTFFLVALIGLLVLKATVALVVIPLGVWAVVLLLKVDQSDTKRLVLFMIGTGLLLTLAVELFYLVGDIGRMNMVFKLYNQAWMLFALAAGACIVWVLEGVAQWRLRTQAVWEVVLIILVFGAFLFPVMATRDKINDRMNMDSPQGLDGMAYMQTATYYDMGMEMDLSEDYAAIQWMQDNIKGSPVILEGQAYEYRWGNRFTIYTGLPGVVGWNYHQRQQRAILRSNVVQERVDDVGMFYLTEDQSFTAKFLDQYDIRYIVVGQLERAFFPGAGLQKFEILDGVLWDEVFRYGSTAIYQVRQ